MRPDRVPAAVPIMLLVALALSGCTTSSAPHPIPSLDRAEAARARRLQAFWGTYQNATRERREKRWAVAATDYRRALAMRPNHWESLYYLGTSLMMLGRWQDAAKPLQRLARISPDARTHSQLGLLYANPRSGRLFSLQHAAAEFRKAHTTNGDESGAVLRMGEVALARGRAREAREDLKSAALTDFGSVAAPFLLGYLDWQAGHRRAAAARFNHAMAITRHHPPPQETWSQKSGAPLFDGIVASLWEEEASVRVMEHNQPDGESTAGKSPRFSLSRMDHLYEEVRSTIRTLQEDGQSHQAEGEAEHGASPPSSVWMRRRNASVRSTPSCWRRRARGSPSSATRPSRRMTMR